MPHDERSPISFEDDEGGKLYAVWSRSGKRLIVTVTRRDGWAQVELRRDQLNELVAFLNRDN